MTTVAMYSHARRKEIREQSIRDFAAVGLEPTTVRVQTSTPKQLHNRQNAWQTLRDAFVGEPVLLLEDDGYPAETLPEWIAFLEATESRCVTLYASAWHFYPEMLRPDRTDRHRMHPHVATLTHLKTWYGSNAVWMPPREIEHVLADVHFMTPELAPWEVALNRSGGPWDRALREHLQARDATMGLVVPNVVQHRAPPSVVNRKAPRMVSPTFNPTIRPPHKPTGAAEVAG